MVSSSLQEIVCCMGQPVAGNPTQYMMESAFAAAGLDARFLTLEVGPEQLGDAMRGLRAMKFRGVVLADPHRTAILEHLDKLSAAAELIGEVNFVQRHGDQLVGDNTVGKGLVRSLDETVNPDGKQVVVLGAGSAARAVAVELALAGASEIVVVNRTAERGQELADMLNQRLEVASRFVHWVDDFRVPKETAITVQATSIGYGDGQARVALDLTSLKSSGIVVEMCFNPPDTKFLRDASALNLAALDGLDVLVNQTAIAFKNWTGIDPDQRVMHEALEEFLMV